MWVRVRSYDVIVDEIKFEDNGISKELLQLGENGEISKKVNFNLILILLHFIDQSALSVPGSDFLFFTVSKVIGTIPYNYYTVLCTTILW